ncbi:threonine aldolase family protein [Pseudonocardia spinosispora]|uniref:threonine aldolase family protein n=1 Tax=Pseudonocardia spinosispora TaxID=103441 RepID=UPI001B7FDF2C|nr:GntG family PLP-dependent aldolase [Pseudonocardia spinosispora]
MRSDTQTLPTDAMRRAMADAELGDETYHEDPTVRHLEDRIAALTGTESAMLVLSGTMANLVALMTHCRPGDEVFLDANVHVLRAEAGGLSRVAGVTPTIVPSARGHLVARDLDAAVRPRDVIRPRPRLVWLENTHNLAGGSVLDPRTQAGIAAVARTHGLSVHLDGARLPNAAAALGTSWSDLTSGVDSVYLDFTKGLACPLGSVLAGPKDFIDEARYHRRVLGGGMRQAGVIAACALVALDTLVERLVLDHETAQLLASELAMSDNYRVINDVETNIVVVDVSKLGSPRFVAERLREVGVIASLRPPHAIRLVTHLQITPALAVETARRMERLATELVIA